MGGIWNSVPPPSESPSSSLLYGGSGPPGESGGTATFIFLPAGVPLLSASLPAGVWPEALEAEYAEVGLLGSLASNLALLPAPEDASLAAMLVLLGPALRPSSANSCGVAVRLGGFCDPGVPARLRSSGYGNGPVGGGDVGAPYWAADAEGGILYCAHCCVGSLEADCGPLLMRKGWGVSDSIGVESCPMNSSLRSAMPAFLCYAPVKRRV